MRQLKYLFLVIFAMCLTPVVSAQITTTTKTTKTSKTKKAKKTKATEHQHLAKFQCPMKCEGEKTYDHAGKCAVCGMNLKELPKAPAAAWQCPMRCEGEKTYAAAGTCPVCKMNLKEIPAKKDKKTDDHGHPHH